AIGIAYCDSSTAGKCHVLVMPWPMPSSKTPSKNVRPLLPVAATALPHATVEWWATDEPRIGLKSLLFRTLGVAWAAPACHRAALRLALLGGLHPSRLRSDVLSSAATVNIPLFEVVLAAFARQAGAGPSKPIGPV